ncbi:Lrp/AsnC family transcriptional regulator [Chloroflexota bacterium]
MSIIDEIDEHILTLMEQNPLQSSERLAKQINVSSATVRRRLKRLIDSKELHIEAYRDPIKTGITVSALVGLNIENELYEEVMERIREVPWVHWACTATGRFDCFLYVRCRSNEDLYFFLKDVLMKIAGIRDSETFMCLHTEKNSRSL